jgi:hypothetical protein
MKASQWKDGARLRHQNSTAEIESLRSIKSKTLGEQATFREFLVSNRQKSNHNARVRTDRKLKEEALRHAASEAETNGLRLVKKSAMKENEHQLDLLANEREKAEYSARVRADQKLKEEALRHAASEAETNGLRLVKKSAMKEKQHQQDLLANERDKSEYSARVRADQKLMEEALRHAASEAETNGLRLVKESAMKENEHQLELLANERKKSEYSACVRADQKLKEEAMRHAASEAETNGLRLVKESAMKENEHQLDLLANEREKSEYSARVRADQKLKEEAMRHAASEAETNGLRLVKKSAMKENEHQLDLLANEREKAEYSARVRADRKLKEEALRHGFSKAVTDGLRLVKESAAKQAEHRHGRIHTAMSPNLNDMLDMFGLGEYRDALHNEVRW